MQEIKLFLIADSTKEQIFSLILLSLFLSSSLFHHPHLYFSHSLFLLFLLCTSYDLKSKIPFRICIAVFSE
jgi:hypothetical protein